MMHALARRSVTASGMPEQAPRGTESTIHQSIQVKPSHPENAWAISALPPSRAQNVRNKPAVAAALNRSSGLPTTGQS